MDWKIAIFALQFISTLVTIGVFCIIKFNDFKHLTKAVSVIAKRLNKQDNRLCKIEKAIVKRDAICSERHKK